MNRAERASRAAEVERLLVAMLDIHQPTLSRQLTVLRQAGIVETRREARQIFYRLTEQKAARLVAALHAIFRAPDPVLLPARRS